MPIPMNKTTSYVKFFDPNVLKKERELIDSWDYEICNQYGMDCWFVSQKAKFPKIRLTTIPNDVAKTQYPLQNDLFFHAYGEISRPEYNEPFLTRVYVQFTEDLFAINGFGLNTDLNTTLIFNKTSFALDGAVAMADNQTINKQFKFSTEIDEHEKFAILNYKSKTLKFRVRFDWKESFARMVDGEVFEFANDPDNYVKPDVLATFKRRYSASKFVERSIVRFKCEDNGFNPITGKRKISGTCTANFIVKNPWKPYADYLNRITPSVGDLVLINGVDDNIIKLEISEVEAENKTQQGISPLLGSYSFKCTAKPYIADNNASVLHDPITAPTDINAKKLIIQTVLNHDASKITDNINIYEKLYTDDEGFDFTEDDVYGGYDLEFPNGLNNPPNVPVNHQPIKTNERFYKWYEYKNKDIQITVDNKNIVYTPDDVYTYLKNLFDSNYTDYLIQQYNTDLSVSYSVFDKDLKAQGWHECIALNVPLWYNEFEKINDKTVSAYTEADRRLHQMVYDSSLFNSFISANTEFINFTNLAAYDGNSNKYKIPIMQKELSSTYINVLSDKQDMTPIDISCSNVYELSAFHVPSTDTEGNPITVTVERYVQGNLEEGFIKYNFRTDLYNIEQYNLGSSEFAKVVKETTPEYKKWKEVNIKKLNKGPLITIYEFESNDNSRLATNGKSLFFETKHDGEIYRSEITSLNEEIIPEKAKTYNGTTVPLNRKLNWIEANQNGVYFNNAYYKRIKLYGKEEIEENKLSHLNYENDISSPPDSFILTFKHSKFYLTVQPTETGIFSLRLSR